MHFITAKPLKYYAKLLKTNHNPIINSLYSCICKLATFSRDHFESLNLNNMNLKMNLSLLEIIFLALKESEDKLLIKISESRSLRFNRELKQATSPYLYYQINVS